MKSQPASGTGGANKSLTWGVNAAMFAALAVMLYLTLFSAVKPDAEGVKYLVGMSQCNLGEPWRIEMNREIAAAAAQYGDMRIIFTDAAQSNEKQIEDVKKLLSLGINILIISPNETEPQDQVIAEAYRKIPVIVLDRKVAGDDYTLFIGADNMQIGVKAGEYIGRILAARGGGHVLEVSGLPGSQPAVERSEGFRRGLAGARGITIDATLMADWLRDKAEDAVAKYVADHEGLPVDVVYAHNDPMALGSYWAMKRMGRDGVIFVGIDGLKGENGGIDLVQRGVLDITFVYPTGGAEAVEYARKLLRGEKIAEKRITLDFAQIDKSNSAQYDARP
ncbi:MAG: substrate-binding domain-containing protein [Synergistaceae bacterium]|jgi:simple sugar transport system substrate-binding protein/ribose transport system substrate-binding protein|nr:substrate-binding domain-containing protein [Synergistaceae bacterium]